MNILRRIIITLFIALLYCIVWIELEKVIDGQVVNRIVDSIIMVLFIPIIYIATGRLIK